ncbi:Diaminobutyrate--2-oxoglutarate aminotransferase [Streptomyces sp. S4.7]|uniref:aminotransferase class III-fold pyridoxal phosphate-dependent enzyme n=1 Tax=Streptomyces sp. S4.7 TaxID=2705439 RepID=UPI0013971759|nr:aminotransferase class III-fold pyridoxal phosphate-dependent enzyme [Streptomyces sp. S4.7]QHY96983.1 Diaminobutyrate--2-oxoglutarate aminotransferase [Streptomyces sp. S4.7]
MTVPAATLSASGYPAGDPDTGDAGAPGDAHSILERQRARESSARTYARSFPIVPARAHGMTIEGVDGRRCLDCLSGAGTLALGHNHPVVREALRRTLDSGAPLHVLDLATPEKDDFTDALFETLPKAFADRARVHFCGPAGTDAVEAALKLTQTATGRRGVLAFTGTFRGNTLAMATGAATLRYVTREGLAERSATVGARMSARLDGLRSELPLIGDVRGRGLMIGVEIIDPEGPSDSCGARPVAPGLAARVQEGCLKRGLILELGGRFGSAVRLLPPLVITDEEAESVPERLTEAIAEVAKAPGKPKPSKAPESVDGAGAVGVSGRAA